MTNRRDLFPPIEPYRTGSLRLDARHTMYWEQSGNPRGAPVLFLHGGPGAGATAVHRRFFDPGHWRIVIFDQRGAGRSTPLGEVTDNTPAHLVADIEQLRTALGIERWLVFGGSWGSTLALDYAATYPSAAPVSSCVESFSAGARRSNGFSTACARYSPKLGAPSPNSFPSANAATSSPPTIVDCSTPTPRVHMPAARAWSIYEGACSTLLPNPETVAAFGEDRLALGLAQIEAHFFSHHLFTGERDLIARVRHLRRLPAVIVQGRYDMVCPIRSADELARAWPEAQYVIVPNAGHSAMEPGIREQLVLATERMKNV